MILKFIALEGQRAIWCEEPGHRGKCGVLWSPAEALGLKNAFLEEKEHPNLAYVAEFQWERRQRIEDEAVAGQIWGQVHIQQRQ